MGKRVGLFLTRFLMVIMTFAVIFLGGVASRTFAGDNVGTTSSEYVELSVVNSFSQMNVVGIIITIVVVILMGVIGALLLDSKKILEK